MNKSKKFLAERIAPMQDGDLSHILNYAKDTFAMRIREAELDVMRRERFGCDERTMKTLNNNLAIYRRVHKVAIGLSLAMEWFGGADALQSAVQQWFLDLKAPDEVTGTDPDTDSVL